MKEAILLKCGEIALKGQNRSSFEQMLMKNARRVLRGTGDFTLRSAQSTICVEPQGPADMDEAFRRLGRVFGIAALCRTAQASKDFEAIRETAGRYLAAELTAADTFKVEAKRSDKRFPMKSPEICRELGAYLLERFPHLRVDVHNPAVTVMVEIRDFDAYIHGNQQTGAGGMPSGSAGLGALLISGGIDSPVAGYLMARRGLALVGVHFASPPYTSERARQKVVALCRRLSLYTGRISLATVPFTDIQQQIAQKCPEEYSTLIMRRFMMELAGVLAGEKGCGALITGESLGQVASQTLPAIACTDAAARLPVFRPVIGLDKEDIIAVARRIGTFETSILPYEDCCNVFTPPHPRTRPRLEGVLVAEQTLDRSRLIEEALKGTAWLDVFPDS